MSANQDAARPLVGWEKELLFKHRWGRHGERAQEEIARLRPLWDAAQPLSATQARILQRITDLEICNWAMEDAVLVLCREIGSQQLSATPIGHLASVSEERWRQLWAYYLAMRAWLPHEGATGYGALLGVCDADRAHRTHISEMLGERSALKELYVERVCLTLEFWLGGYHPEGSAHQRGHAAAVAALEEEIRKLDPQGEILAALRGDGDGRLQPCNHKCFRRLDIIISSIGVGRWRGAMPMRGTDGLARAAQVEALLRPIEDWIEGRAPGCTDDGLAARVHAALGTPVPAKFFLAALLVSVLRGQAISAHKRASARVQPG